MKRIIFIIGILLAGLSPLACQKTYNVNPLAASVTAPTATPTCSPYGGSPITCTTGITWGYAWVAGYNVNSVYQYAATLALAVDCLPETTDGVTLTGPGVDLPLTYSNSSTIAGTAGGTLYAVYGSNSVTGNLTVGSPYTLTTVTSIGTATSTILLNSINSLTFSTDGTSISWNGYGCNINLFLWQSGSIFFDYTGAGYEAASPLILPHTCTSPCSEGADFIASTTNINGGSGIYYISNGVIQTFP